MASGVPAGMIFTGISLALFFLFLFYLFLFLARSSSYWVNLVFYGLVYICLRSLISALFWGSSDWNFVVELFFFLIVLFLLLLLLLLSVSINGSAGVRSSNRRCAFANALNRFVVAVETRWKVIEFHLGAISRPAVVIGRSMTKLFFFPFGWADIEANVAQWRPLSRSRTAPFYAAPSSNEWTSQRMNDVRRRRIATESTVCQNETKQQQQKKKNKVDGLFFFDFSFAFFFVFFGIGRGV